MVKSIFYFTNISHLLSHVIPTNGKNLSLGMLRFEGLIQFFKTIRAHQISRAVYPEPVEGLEMT